MAFAVAARTVLELGSELISNDSVALYELIKNAVDAGSASGVDIRVYNTFSHVSYEAVKEKVENREIDSIDALREAVFSRIEKDADEDLVAQIEEVFQESQNTDDVYAVLDEIYDEYTYLEIEDLGHGMSLADLQGAFLTIGTTSRATHNLEKLNKGTESGDKPYLGEKGVGRLSAMRLGEILEVSTTKEGERHYNELRIDWNDFASKPASLIGDIKVEPERGEKKEDPAEHGTTITIGRLSVTWSKDYAQKIASVSVAKLLDPFGSARDRFPIRIEYNGVSLDYFDRVRKVLLKNAHGELHGKYAIDNGSPNLKLEMSQSLYGEESQRTEKYASSELPEILLEHLKEVPEQALKKVGPFSFDLYWYNRGKLKAGNGIDSVSEFRELLDDWYGILVYRDGYQVMPYGLSGNDWLDLDRKALKSQGFKLNKYQFVGRVRISRFANPLLIDQTNREGLRDCDEKEVFFSAIHFAIFTPFKTFIEEAERAARAPDYDTKTSTSEVNRLSDQTRKVFKKVKGATPEDRNLIRQINESFDSLLVQYKFAAQHIKTIENEHERLVQLAGIGLSVEMVAHELSRVVNSTYHLLERRGTSKEENTDAFFKALSSQVKTIDKRLRLLDPLSVSGRNRKTEFDLRDTVENVVESHQAKIERHKIQIQILPVKKATVKVKAVEGKIIQIIENLLVNAYYWLDVNNRHHPGFTKKIDIEVLDGPPRIKITDNGIGVPKERAEKIFTANFSTKKESKRRGLGLYIARENAEYHGGTLYLSTSENRLPNGWYSTFVFEMPESGK